MKATKKNRVLITLALGAAMAVSVGVAQIVGGNISASAISVDTDRIASDGFAMKVGASVRYKDNDGDGVNDEAGIRWATEVSEEFTKWLEREYAGASFEWRTLITAANKLGDASVTMLTVENAETLLCNDTRGTLSDGEYYGAVLYRSDATDGWESLTDEQLRSIYATELVARSYVKITKTNGEDEIVYAKADDTARSMRAVANAALMKGEDALLNKYVGTVSTQTKNAGVYDPDENEGNVTLDLSELDDGTYTAYAGAKLVGEVEVSDGSATMSAASVADGEQTASLFDGSANVYRVPFIKATKVLKQASDLAMFDLKNIYENIKNVTTVFDGYYVLGNDIDASDYNHKSIGYTDASTTYTNVGLTGTFNGMGYKISNLTFAGNASMKTDGKTDDDTYKCMNYSLFGIVCGGTIKNVGIVNAGYNNVGTGVNKADKSVLANAMYGAKLENVYVQLNGLSYGSPSIYSSSSGVAYHIDAQTTMKNCIFDIRDDGTIKKDDSSTGFGALSGDGGKYENNDMSNVTDRAWTNVFVISSIALSHEKNGGKHYEFFGKNLNKTTSDTADELRHYENITQYLSREDMVDANIDYEALGFTSSNGWKLVEGYAPTWNGVALNEKTVNYTVNLDAEKTQLSENDLTALFGNTTTKLVSISTSDSKYGVSYTNDAISVTGAAWNGEKLTAIFSDGDWNVTASVRLCTKVITTIEGLSQTLNLGIGYPKNVAADGTVSSIADPGTNATLNRAVSGYYALGNNIDASGYKYSTHGYISSVWSSNKQTDLGFVGTFDGCGYTVSNVTFGEMNESEAYTQPVGTTETGGGILYKEYNYSIFGVINPNATVKNVAFTNVDYGNIPSSATKATVSALAMWINNATIENVYVSVKDLNGTDYSSRCGLAYGIFKSTIMKNVVVEIQKVSATTTEPNFGSISCRLPANDFEMPTKWENVYVLSDRRLVGSSGGATSTDTYSTDVDAQNISAVDESKKHYRFTNVYRYADTEAWKAVTGDYTSFEDAYWDVTTGVPVWKTAADSNE